MKPPDLPADLQEVDRRLLARPRPKPSPAHRTRVLAAVRDALAARRLPWWRRPGAWQMAAAAAVLILWVNVAVSTFEKPFEFPSDGGNGHSLRASAEAIRTLVPQLAEQEALRQALLLRAGAAVRALPRLRVEAGEGRGLVYPKEVSSWVLP